MEIGGWKGSLGGHRVSVMDLRGRVGGLCLTTGCGLSGAYEK